MMNQNGPESRLDIHSTLDGRYGPLPARNCLSALNANVSLHDERDRRHPLGVYNLSIARICDKVEKCARKLEVFWTSNEPLDNFQADIVDYLELSMYAAAEHVDDVEYIADTFYRTSRETAKSAQVRKLKNEIKPLRDEIASYVNTIKHAHGRIRLYQHKFTHAHHPIPLVGFFIEGYKDGRVGPNPVLHSGGKTVVSITSILWNILTYIAEISRCLQLFLVSINACDATNEERQRTEDYHRTAVALARLPAYSFDDVHPFERAVWSVSVNDLGDLASNIYGSISNKWIDSTHFIYGDHSVSYTSDGISRSFAIVRPQTIKLSHWK